MSMSPKECEHDLYFIRQSPEQGKISFPFRSLDPDGVCNVLGYDK